MEISKQCKGTKTKSLKKDPTSPDYQLTAHQWEFVSKH